MTWTEYSDNSGNLWQINQVGLFALCRTAARADLVKRHTKVTPVSHGILMPTTYDVDTEWREVEQSTEQRSRMVYQDMADLLFQNGAAGLGRLNDLINQARRDHAHVKMQRQNAMSASLRNVHSNVGGWETATAVTRAIRDISIGTLVALSAIPTVGTSAAAVGSFSLANASALTTGSLMKGFATYTDTGKVGPALISGTTTLTVGLMSIGAGQAALSSADKWTMMFLQSFKSGAGTGIETLADGKSVEVAGQRALASMGLSAIGGSAQMTRMFQKLSMPTQVSINVGYSFAGDSTVAAIGDGARGAGAARATVLAPTVSGRLTEFGIPVSADGNQAFLNAHVMRRR